MNTEYALNLEGEQAWLRLKQHIEWSDQFGLGFIFSAHPQVISLFRQRLAEIYRARVTQLHIPIPEEPAQLFTELLPALLHPSVHQQALQAPYWLDLSKQWSKAWTDARLSFLTRLNEQREPLRRALTRPLILVLPLTERVRIKALVPDLWAIRDFSLVTDDWLVGQPEDPPVSELPPSSSFQLNSYQLSLIDEWKRLLNKQVVGRDFLLPAQRALEAALQAGHYQLADKIAVSMKQAAEQSVKERGETPESLRDLSVSLDNVGNTAKALGDYTEARVHFTESLQIRQQIVERVGETPESLRDLSVSLSNLGDMARALVDREKAKAYFEEGLAIADTLGKIFPDHVDYSNISDHFKQRLEDLQTQKQ